MKKKIKQILELIEKLVADRFAGILTLRLHFQQGGIRSVHKIIETRLEDNSDS